MLREEGNLFLHDKPAKISSSEENEIHIYLENEYLREAQEYPFNAPQFDKNIALWSAKTVYHAALFILFRRESERSIEKLFPFYDQNLNASQILSADLLLRYLPFLYHTLENIDPNDMVLDRLEHILDKFHYSAIDLHYQPKKLELSTYFSNICVKQLFFNRIVEQKNQNWGIHPEINTKIIQHLGFYKNQIWDSLDAITITTDESE